MQEELNYSRVSKMSCRVRAKYSGFYFNDSKSEVLHVSDPFPFYSQPISMTQMEKIFSGLVLGETLPKPTLVRLLKVKYKAVTYLSLIEGPEAGSLSL